MLTRRQKDLADRLAANRIDWRQIARTIGASYQETTYHLSHRRSREDHDDMQALRKTHHDTQPTLL